MRRASWGALGVLLALSWVSPLDAGWNEFWHRVHVDFKRMNCWPEPFVEMDRHAAAAPFEAFKDAGWRLENTLVEFLFTEDQQLTHAGKLKVRHILTQVPAHRRNIFVLQGETPEITERRVDAVQRAVAEILVDGPLPPVLVTDQIPRSGSGDYLNTVNRKYRESIPAPVLPEAEGSSSESN
jgi:hypothetical protein